MRKIYSILLHPVVLAVLFWFGSWFYIGYLLKEARVESVEDFAQLVSGSEFEKKELEAIEVEKRRQEWKEKQEKRDREAKVEAIRAMLLEIGSPLYDKADYFVYISDLYDLPWWLLPSICVAESGCGKRVHKKYNPFGWGQVEFMSWEDAIETVGRGLRKYYFDLGCDDFECIWKRYSGGDYNWWRNVLAAKTRLEEFYLKFNYSK